MSHKQKMQEYLSKYNIAMPIDNFVSVTSNIYHSYEAREYDERHFSIEYSKKYWSKVTDLIAQNFADQNQLTVLDFGCGTGFATEQLLHSALNPKVSAISCYDLSEDMIAVCQQKFTTNPKFSFFSNAKGYEEMLSRNEKYDIVVCNALMHHILEPESVFQLINGLLKTDGIFVMGHEPNKKFYQNDMLQSVSKIFRLYKRVSRRLFAKKIATTNINISIATHTELVKKDIVPKDFPSSIIPKFVDIHVPMSNYKVQPWGEPGFDIDYVNRYLDNNFKIVAQITYSHIKDQQAYKTFLWRNAATALSKIFPADGADAIFVFKKQKESNLPQ